MIAHPRVTLVLTRHESLNSTQAEPLAPPYHTLMTYSFNSIWA
jgi:hypothetical protein